MADTIRLKYSDKGIGVNFFNEKEEKLYKDIIHHIQPMVSEDVKLGISDITWDLDNMKLGHKNPKANQLLNKISLQLVA